MFIYVLGRRYLSVGIDLLRSLFAFSSLHHRGLIKIRTRMKKSLWTSNSKLHDRYMQCAALSMSSCRNATLTFPLCSLFIIFQQNFVAIVFSRNIRQALSTTYAINQSHSHFSAEFVPHLCKVVHVIFPRQKKLWTIAKIRNVQQIAVGSLLSKIILISIAKIVADLPF